MNMQKVPVLPVKETEDEDFYLGSQQEADYLEEMEGFFVLLAYALAVILAGGLGYGIWKLLQTYAHF